MLIFGQGTLCLFDGIDAIFESGGEAINFFLHMNLIAWFKFCTLVFKEISIRFKLSKSEEIDTSAYGCLSAELISLDGRNVYEREKFIDEIDYITTENDVKNAMIKLNLNYSRRSREGG